MNEPTIITIPSLPTASQSYANKLYRLVVPGADDVFYVCKRSSAGVWSWVDIGAVGGGGGSGLITAIADTASIDLSESSGTLSAAAIFGTTAGTVAVGNHNHTGVYSLTSHNHDASYSLLAHTHATYALTGHNHDASYALLAHTHTGTYQPLDTDLTTIAGLADPNADRVLFWDDSAGAYTYLTVANNLAITGTTLDGTHTHGGVYQPLDPDLTTIAGLADPNADRILFWDDSAGAYAYLTAGTNLSITGTTIDAAGGGAGGAPTTATYITQVADAGLSNEQALSSLATGLLKNTTGTGVLSIAVAGTDYAIVAHNHDASYSALAHNHDASYSAIAHTHAGVYSPVAHTHDADYVNVAGDTMTGNLIIDKDFNGSFRVRTGAGQDRLSVDTSNGRFNLSNGMDVQVFSDNYTTLTASVDGATGNIGTAGFVEIAGQSAPATPASGLARLYTNTSGLLYQKDDLGIERPLHGQIPYGFGPTTQSGRGLSLASILPIGTYVGVTLGANKAYYIPVWTADSFTIDAVVFEVTTAVAGTSRVGIYSSTNALLPGTKLGESTTAADLGTTGLKIRTLSAGVSVVAGTWIFLALSVTSAVAVRGSITNVPGLRGMGATTTANIIQGNLLTEEATASAALPTTASAGSSSGATYLHLLARR